MKMFALIVSACFLLVTTFRSSTTVLSDEPTPTPIHFIEVAKWGEEDTSSPNWRTWQKLHISPDGKRIAALHVGDIFIWNLEGEIIQVIENKPVLDFAWSPDSRSIAGCCSNDDETSSLMIWDLETGETITTLVFESPIFATGISWSPEGNLIASTGSGLLVWDMESKTSPIVLNSGIAGESVVWSPQGDRLANVGLDFGTDSSFPTGALEIWNMGSSPLLTDIGEAYRVVAWHPDGEMLASMADIGAIGVWDIETGAELFRLQLPEVNIIALAWHPDGQLLASGDTGGRVRIWDTHAKAEFAVVEGHPTTVVGDGWENSNVISGLDWDAQGEFLVSAGYDGTIRIWRQF